MKLFFSTIFFFFLSLPLFSNDFETKYKIKNRGITIGSLTWALTIKDGSYTTSLYLKNNGLLSALYPFEGKYKAVGKIKNNFLFSKEYNQFWKTQKKEKIVKIVYNNMKIKEMTLSPIEQEVARIEYDKLENYNDPLTSFLNILFNQKPSYTIDGRRAYLLYPTKKENVVKISIKEYENIWADHKRNDLEYIEIFIKKDRHLPKKINIMFKGSVFSLNKI